MQIPHLLWLFVLLFKGIHPREEWIDPHDMNIGVRYQEKVNHGTCNCNEVITDRHSFRLKKIIGLLIDRVHFDKSSEFYEGHIGIQMKTQDYIFLRDFISNDDDHQVILRRLDTILDSFLGQTSYDTLFTFGEYIYLCIYNEHLILAGVLLVIVYILWKMEPHNYNIRTLFKIFLPLIYISDFVLRYMALIEEVEIDKYLALKKSDPGQLGWIDWFCKKLFREDPENERSLMLSQRATIYIATPMKVLAEQFDIVVPIMKHLGNGCGKFILAMIDDVPWYVKPGMALLAFILAVIVLLMMSSFFLGVYPKFNIFHVLSLEFLYKEQQNQINRPQNQQDCISGDNLTLLLKSSASQKNFKFPLKFNQHKGDSIATKSNKTLTYKTKRKNKISSIKNLKSASIGTTTENRAIEFKEDTSNSESN